MRRFLDEDDYVGIWAVNGERQDEYEHSNPTLPELTREALRLNEQCDESLKPHYIAENGTYHPDHYKKIARSWEKVVQFLELSGSLCRVQDDMSDWHFSFGEETAIRLNPKIGPHRRPSSLEGSHPGYGTNWGEIRADIIDRDRESCRVCGSDGSEHGLDVHHIRPAREFDSPDDGMNEMDNLITLCKRCHGNLEGMFRDTDPDEFAELGREEVEVTTEREGRPA